MPFAITAKGLGAVADDILVAQLDSKFGGYVGKITWTIYNECAASGKLSDITQHLWA